MYVRLPSGTPSFCCHHTYTSPRDKKTHILCVPRIHRPGRDLAPFILYNEACCKSTQTTQVWFHYYYYYYYCVIWMTGKQRPTFLVTWWYGTFYVQTPTAERLGSLNTFSPTNEYLVLPVPTQLKQQSKLHPNPSGGTNPQLPPA